MNKKGTPRCFSTAGKLSPKMRQVTGWSHYQHCRAIVASLENSVFCTPWLGNFWWKWWLSFTNKTRKIAYFGGSTYDLIETLFPFYSNIATGKNKRPQSSNELMSWLLMIHDDLKPMDFIHRRKHNRWNATSFAYLLVHGVSLWCNLKRNSSPVNPP